MLVDLRNLTKNFGATAAVKNASFRIEGPAMVGVIGPSGAGKSTLLRMINRLADATSGEALIDGVDVLKLRGRKKRRWQRDCAMIFQQFNLVPRLDVLTNVMLGRLNSQNIAASMFAVFSKEDVRDGLAALARLGIEEQALKRAEALSGGQQQRVAIARALMQKPRMILADEPIASLDPLSAEIVMKSLREIHERDGLTVVCNLHTLDTARAYCDRIVGMRLGEIVYNGPPSGLTSSVVREIYGADQEINEAATSTSITAGPPAAAQIASVAAAP